jgi:hypothetical protein
LPAEPQIARLLRRIADGASASAGDGQGGVAITSGVQKALSREEKVAAIFSKFDTRTTGRLQVSAMRRAFLHGRGGVVRG